MEEEIGMVVGELKRHEILIKVQTGILTQLEAGAQLGITDRQIRRLLKKLAKEGVRGLRSKHRGKVSNNRLAEEVKEQVLKLSRGIYQGFAPTFLHEKLVEEHQLTISVESVRKLLINAGIWRPKVKRVERIFQLRPRRSRFGELIQIDGSDHDWFEGRSERCTLLVFIDDATSRLTYLQFVEDETTLDYFAGVERHINQYGIPAAFYSDCHGIFRVNIQGAQSGDGLTQFGRACKELGIESIQALSPQAKGRVERANQTLQDRLVKEMRLRGINSMEAGNAYLNEFMADYNRRFAVLPASGEDAHSVLQHSKQELERILSIQSKRILSDSLTCQFNNQLFQIKTVGQGLGLRKAQVLVCQRHASLTIWHNQQRLEFDVWQKNNSPADPVSEKELNKKVDQAIKKQARMPWKPDISHPWRKAFKEQTKTHSSLVSS